MAYRGKIGFHFPGRDNPNIDTGDIKFLPAGITNPTSNDLVQIDKVYAIPAGVTITSVADLQNYVVWEKVAGYVKYYIQLEDSGNSNFVFGALYKDGSLVGDTFTNAVRAQDNNYNWQACGSDKIAALRAGEAPGTDLAWGTALRLTYTTTNLTSFGFKVNGFMGHNHYIIKIYGVDADNNQILLKTAEISNIQMNNIYTVPVGAGNVEIEQYVSNNYTRRF